MRSKENKNRFIEVGILANKMNTEHKESRKNKLETAKQKEVFRATRRLI